MWDENTLIRQDLNTLKSESDVNTMRSRIIHGVIIKKMSEMIQSNETEIDAIRLYIEKRDEKNSIGYQMKMIEDYWNKIIK